VLRSGTNEFRGSAYEFNRVNARATVGTEDTEAFGAKVDHRLNQSDSLSVRCSFSDPEDRRLSASPPDAAAGALALFPRADRSRPAGQDRFSILQESNNLIDRGAGCG
jgi:hypothetical protein